MSLDRIHKQILLPVPPARVWQALTDPSEFRAWFGVEFQHPFTPGVTAVGRLVGTSVDPEIAKAQQAHAAVPFEMTIEQMDAGRLFSFRWHPFAVEPGGDYSAEPTTLIEFVIQPVTDGVQVTLTESGFDRLPAARRDQAYAANDGGWTLMMQLLEKYLTAV